MNRDKIFYFVIFFVIALSIASLIFSYINGYTLVYGDAESHLNIAKRVINGITPGLGQLGGVWLPLPHLLMIPFIWNDYMWRTGLGGAIPSALSFIISSLFIYKTIFLLTRDRGGSLLGTLAFIINPNILYVQSTPLGELPLIATIILSSYYLIVWIKTDNFIYLTISAFFICLGTLIRYDAWFFVGTALVIIPLIAIVKKYRLSKIESTCVLYFSLAFVGVIIWLVWNYLIFKNPIYFLSSPYSAHAQQLEWLKKGQLPSYHNIISSVIFYTIAVLQNSGFITFIVGLSGILFYLIYIFIDREKTSHFLALLLLLSPYAFYIVTMYLGISIILIPGLVPESFHVSLFNIRYGVMILPGLVVFIGLLASYAKIIGKLIILLLLIFQIFLFIESGYPVVLQDGLFGLSGRKPSPTNFYLAKNYDYGYVMFDDYSRTSNPVSLNTPMNKIIYVGNHPYWEESLEHPTKYVRWFVIRHDNGDVLWKKFKNNKEFKMNYHGVYNWGETYVYRRN